ncbi:MAG: hypothetical protein RBS39_02935 [Phycisphaerales bacterium]|jgi:hypothetical protein|nr:hypothetical protein [Phycisphaerales bacterium]
MAGETPLSMSRGALFRPGIGVIAVACGVLSGALGASAVFKALDPEDSLATIRYLLRFCSAPANFAFPLLLVLVSWQWLLAALLLTSSGLRRFAAANATLMLVAFSVVVSYLWLSDAPVGCGCGLGLRDARLATQVGFVDVLKTAGLAGASVVVWQGSPRIRFNEKEGSHNV